MVLSAERPELVAAAQVDPHDLIAYGGSRASVRHVLVAGEVLVQDGALTHLNLNEIRLQATRHLDQLLRRADLQI
jgi:5-methylthioadenosine/S-adenosylhomocysteine deaminase